MTSRTQRTGPPQTKKNWSPFSEPAACVDARFPSTKHTSDVAGQVRAALNKRGGEGEDRITLESSGARFPHHQARASSKLGRSFSHQITRPAPCSRNGHRILQGCRKRKNETGCAAGWTGAPDSPKKKMGARISEESHGDRAAYRKWTASAGLSSSIHSREPLPLRAATARTTGTPAKNIQSSRRPRW